MKAKSLRLKLLMIFLMAGLFPCVGGLIGWWRSVGMRSEMSRLQQLESVRQAISELQAVELSRFQLALLGKPSADPAAAAGFPQTSAAPADCTALLASLRPAFDGLVQAWSRLGSLRPGEAPDSPALGNVRACLDRLITECQDVQKKLDGLITQHNENALKAAGLFEVMALATPIAALPLALGFGLFLAAYVSKPIRSAADLLSATGKESADAAARASSSRSELSDGASLQAASLQETSASLQQLSSMAARNSDLAAQANRLSVETRSSADEGVRDMQAMSNAMKEIERSNADIEHIIGTIDDIAFQTNVLALNAAVEAARAGEAGAGFAVVANEVRTLAQRSAEAAKETSAKIESAIAKSRQGITLTAQVAKALGSISAKTREVDQLAAAVATASREQTQGIDQIKKAVGQIEQITERNARHADESATAVQRLQSQAEVMNASVGSLMVLVGAR